MTRAPNERGAAAPHETQSPLRRAPGKFALRTVRSPGGGAGALVRPLEPADADRVVRFLGRLTPASTYGRFFTRFPQVPEPLLRQLVAVDHAQHEALVLEVGGDILALASYHREPADPSTAEVAVVVQDACQRTGVARLLLRRLARLARRRGIEQFAATVLGENRPALGLTRALAPHATLTVDGPEVRVLIRLQPAPAAA